MSEQAELIREFAKQIGEFDSRMEAFEAAVADPDIQFLLSFVAENEPELLDRYHLWDMLGDREAWRKQATPKVGGLDGNLIVHHYQADETE